MSKTNKVYWYRYRVGTSASRGDWKYVISSSPNEKEMAEYLEDVHGLHWSEHYRGTTVQKIRPDQVPVGVLQAKIRELHDRIPSLQREIESTRKEMGDLESQYENGEFRIQRKTKCRSCKGTGKMTGYGNNVFPCHYCKGSGRREWDEQH